MSKPDPLDSLVEKIVEVDQKVTRLDAKTQVREEKERPSPAEAAERVGLPRDYLAAEENVWKRLSPFGDRWDELRKYGEQAAEFEMRQAAIANELREMHEWARVAPDRDAEALAEWELQGRLGDRPEPSLPAIVRDIKALQEEREGLDRAITRVLNDKASYVRRHRRRLKKQAKDGVNEAADRYLELVDELAAARQELRSRRRDEVIAALYPAQEAMAEPPDMLCGSRKKPLQLAGINGPVAPERPFDALREDARYRARRLHRSRSSPSRAATRASHRTRSGSTRRKRRPSGRDGWRHGRGAHERTLGVTPPNAGEGWACAADRAPNYPRSLASDRKS